MRLKRAFGRTRHRLPVLGYRPPALLKGVLEGDSITYAYGIYDVFEAANPSVDIVNLAVTSAGVGTSADAPGTNSLWGRIHLVIAEKPDFVTILIGTNDLAHTASADIWRMNLYAYIAALKAALPGVMVFLSTIVPHASLENPYEEHNARRAYLNPIILADAGKHHDAAIPMGDHPVVSTDAAAENPDLWEDRVHPSPEGAEMLGQVANAVLSPAVARRIGGTPAAPTFTNLNNAAAGETYLSYNIVTGLGLRETTNAAVTGAGEIAVGLNGDIDAGGGTFDTSLAGLVNGQVVTSKVDADETASTAVTHTLTWSRGNVSGAWTLTTAGAELTLTYRSSATAAPFANTLTFEDVEVFGGFQHLVLFAVGNHIGLPAAVLGSAMTKLDAEAVDPSNDSIFAFVLEVAEDGVADLTITVTGEFATMGNCGYALLTIDEGAEVHNFATKLAIVTPEDPYAPYSLDPQRTSADLEVPAGGKGVFMMQVNNTGMNVTPGTGCTELAEFVRGTAKTFYVGGISDTGRPAAYTGDWSGSQMLAISFGS